MKNKNELYKRYTSTSSLPNGVDEETLLTWSKGYFRANYLHLLPQDKNAKILEVGCGYGRYIAVLSEMGYTNCYGIDISHEQITHAKNILKLVNVEEADAFDWLNNKVDEFDCVLGLDILEHFETDDLLKLGVSIYKALKPGGTVIFQVPNGMSPINPFIYGDLTHFRAFTPQSMKQFLLHVGFVPMGYFEIPPYVYGIKSAIRRGCWMAIIKPLISFVVLVIHSRVLGVDIYTSNFITLAKKEI